MKCAIEEPGARSRGNPANVKIQAGLLASSLQPNRSR
jgi:hypothetical protein